MLKVLSNKFSCVLQADKINAAQIQRYLDLNNDSLLFSAFILHDKDYLDNGEVKTSHYHLLLLLNKDRDKFAILKDMARFFICETDAISIRIANDWRACCLYITHDYYNNNCDILPIDSKYHYSIDNVSVSNYGLYMQYRNGSVDIDYKDINIQTLLQFISLGYTFTEIALEIGIKNANRYRALILSLLDERYYIAAIKDSQVNKNGIYSKKLEEFVKNGK